MGRSDPGRAGCVVVGGLPARATARDAVGNPTQKGRYWGVELPPRSVLAQGLDTVGQWLLPVVEWPLLGKFAQLWRKWARDAFLGPS